MLSREDHIVLLHPNYVANLETPRAIGCQIDYLIQTRFSSLFLCEIKFKKNEIGTEIISEIEEKINKLKTPRNFSIRPVLIHVNGLSDELLEKDYFYKTIDFSQMLE